jgi:tryptophan synthase
MSERIRAALGKTNGKPAFIAYLTAGYPLLNITSQLLLAVQQGGVDIIELGVPFSDPLADGPVIQLSNQVALSPPNCVGYSECLNVVKESREIGVVVPIVLMGYYNPLIQYGEEKAVEDAKRAGVDGFIVVDLPAEEAQVEGGFADICKNKGLSFIPLAALTTREERLKNIVGLADSFVYCVSVNGVTGARAAVNDELPAFLARIRNAMTRKVPLAVGFGISNREQFLHVAQHAEAVVIGSALIKIIAEVYDLSKPPVLSDAADQKERETRLIKAVGEFASKVSGKN